METDNKSKSSEYLNNFKLEKIQPISAFQEFKIDSWEWDNIPKVIPHFSIYLQKYVKELAVICTDYADSGINEKIGVLEKAF